MLFAKIKTTSCGLSLNLKDKKNYLKGLILLNAGSGGIKDAGMNNFVRIGISLGLNEQLIEYLIYETCETGIKNEEPLQFSNAELAKIFIRDGIKVAFIERIVNLPKLQWLSVTALKNNLSEDWLMKELNYFFLNYEDKQDEVFEIQKYTQRTYS